MAGSSRPGRGGRDTDSGRGGGGPQGPDVGGPAVALAAEDLGGDGGEAAEAGVSEVEEPVQRAVVGQLEGGAAAQEQAVGRLQVAVEQPLPVQIRQPRCRLPPQRPRRLRRQRPARAPEEGLDAAAAAVVGHETQRPALHGAAPHRRQRRVSEGPSPPHLPEEEGGVRRAARKHLERQPFARV